MSSLRRGGLRTVRPTNAAEAEISFGNRLVGFREERCLSNVSTAQPISNQPNRLRIENFFFAEGGMRSLRLP